MPENTRYTTTDHLANVPHPAGATWVDPGTGTRPMKGSVGGPYFGTVRDTESRLIQIIGTRPWTGGEQLVAVDQVDDDPVHAASPQAARVAADEPMASAMTGKRHY